MIKSQLTTSVRYLLRQRGFTIINIAGLAIGMAIAILIYIWVINELSYDRFNEKYDRIYRLIQTQHYASGPLTTVCMPGPIARDIRNEIPEIVNSFMYYNTSVTVSHEEKVFTEEIRLADPQLFEMFDFEFLEGQADNVFNEIKSVIITDKMATKFFEEEDPIGKILKLNNELEFRVSGIIKETPENSSFRFDICIPFENIEEMGFTVDSYGWNTYYVYVELGENINYHDVNNKIKKYLEGKSKDQYLADNNDIEDYDSDIDLFLFPEKNLPSTISIPMVSI